MGNWISVLSILDYFHSEEMDTTYEFSDVDGFINITINFADPHYDYYGYKRLVFIDGKLVHIYPFKNNRVIQFLSPMEKSVQQKFSSNLKFSQSITVDFQQKSIYFSLSTGAFYQIYQFSSRHGFYLVSDATFNLKNGFFAFVDAASNQMFHPYSNGLGSTTVLLYNFQKEFAHRIRDRHVCVIHANLNAAHCFLYDPINKYIITDDYKAISCYDLDGKLQIKIDETLGYSEEIEHLQPPGSDPKHWRPLNFYDYCLINRNRLLISSNLGLLVYDLGRRTLIITRKTPVLTRLAFDIRTGTIAGFQDKNIVVIPPNSWIFTSPYWTVETHSEFPQEIKDVVKIFTMIRSTCWNNSSWNVISLLPNELLFEIFGYL